MSVELDQEAAISYLLEHVAATLARHTDQILMEQLGVGFAQYKIMTVLQRQTNLAQREVADHLGQTEASISRQVKILRAKGLVISEIDPENRRVHYLVLTTKGAQLTEVAAQAIARYQKPAMHQLGEKQRKQLYEALAGLHAALCTSSDPAACDHPFSV